ncbi:MAG: M48 family peptidase, partial [Ferrovum sp.]|nr:M48 family peptidase [Ferrovum sp.]
MLFHLVFLTLLAGVTGGRLWLAYRQIRHIQRYRQSVPAPFQTRISLEDHQKAADYTCAKTKLRMIHTLTDALLLLVFIEAGMLEGVDRLLLDAWGNGWLHDLALGGSVLLIGALVDLPLSLYGTFGVEARYGFNRITPQLFLMDLLRESLITIGLGAPVFLAAVWMMNSLGNLWWLWAWAAWMA